MAPQNSIGGVLSPRLLIVAGMLGLLTFGGTLVVLESVTGGQGGGSHSAACGQQDCAAGPPGGTPSAPAPSPSRASQNRPFKTPATPTHPPRPSPSATPTAEVSVSFVARSDGGEYVITNHGQAVLAGWRLSFTISHGRVTSVWPGTWDRSGKTVTITGQPVAPGAGIVIHFQVTGRSTTPVGCVLNGSPCR